MLFLATQTKKENQENIPHKHPGWPLQSCKLNIKSPAMHGYMFAFLICCVTFSHAQSVITRMGARGAAMGYANFAVPDESALLNNVGGLSRVKRTSVFFACEAAPELPGANRKAAAATWVSNLGAVGVSLFRFGDNRYNEQILSAGFSNSLGIASLGAKVNYIQYQAEGFGTKNTITIDVGGLAEITPLLSVGAGIFNLTQSTIAEGEQLPVIMVAGLGFKPDTRFLLTTEIEKQLRFPTIWKMGLEYSAHNKIFFRTGFNLSPMAVFAGLGIRVKRIAMDYSIRYSRVLGIAVQGSASYQLGEIRKK